MNLTRAFSYMFDDPDWWQLVLVVGLLQLVPIIGQIVALGCILFTARAVANGSDRPLPRLNQFGAIFREGLYGAFISIVYYLPIFFIICIFSCLLIGVVVATSTNEPPIGVLIGFALCINLILVLLALITQPLLIVASGRYVQTGSAGAALQLGEVFALLRRNPAEWLVLWLLSIVCNIVAGLGSIAFIFGALFTTAYAALVFGHLLGQTVRHVSSPALL